MGLFQKWLELGTGSIILSKDLELKYVFHVLNLDCNLLSMSKLSEDRNCCAKFNPNLCDFRFWIRGGRLKVLGCAQDFTSSKSMNLPEDELPMQYVLGLMSAK